MRITLEDWANIKFVQTKSDTILDDIKTPNLFEMRLLTFYGGTYQKEPYDTAYRLEKQLFEDIKKKYIEETKKVWLDEISYRHVKSKNINTSQLVTILLEDKNFIEIRDKDMSKEAEKWFDERYKNFTIKYELVLNHWQEKYRGVEEFPF